MEETAHKIILQDRRDLLLTGVTAVDSSEDKKIVLKTVLGALIVEGSDLHIRHLDLESSEAAVGGKVSSLIYLEQDAPQKNKSGRNLGKLFK